VFEFVKIDPSIYTGFAFSMQILSTPMPNAKPV